MPQTYQRLENDQFIMTFADLEGDLPFLERSLVLYREEYRKIYPGVRLDKDDFTIAVEHGNRFIKFPQNVICVNIGDLTDKTRSNTGRENCYNLALVDILSNTHDVYGDRMVSILGNRETTKFRLQNELNNRYINQVLEQEFRLSPNDRKLTADKRPINYTWVDGPARSFLTYLKSALLIEDKTINHEMASKLNLDDLRLTSLSDEEVRAFFNSKDSEEQQILYAKWLLANSCGAPDLWDDIATEAETTNDFETLNVLQNYFSDRKGPYVNYLRHCQIGAQIGNVLFTHGGLEDNSFNLPKTLLSVLSRQQIQSIFGVSADKLLQKNGRVVAQSAMQMLSALNTWYANLMEYRFDHKGEQNDVMEAAVVELLEMGLPRSRHQGASVINCAFTDKDGAYGNPITAETHAKLLHNEDAEPIHISYQGHMPAEVPRMGCVFNEIDGKKVLLQRIAGDTCNYRQNEAAVMLSVRSENNHTVVNLARVGREPNAIKTRQMLTSRSAIGILEAENGRNLDETMFSYYGRQIKFSEADRGWNINHYNQEKDTVVLFKQNGPTNNPQTHFKPEYREVDRAHILALLERGNNDEVASVVKSQVNMDKGAAPVASAKPVKEQERLIVEVPAAMHAKKVNDEHILTEQLINAAKSAQVKYANHYKDNACSSRGPNGFFSWFRHGQTGQNNAINFIKDMNHENVIECVERLLRSPDTRYHRHSFSSFLLDELQNCDVLNSKKLVCTNNIYDRGACLKILEDLGLFNNELAVKSNAVS